MSARSQIIAQVTEQLLPGERILDVSPVQVKGGQKKALAQSAAVSTAATVLLGVVGSGFGLMVTFSPPAGYALVTTERLVVLDRRRSGRAPHQTLFLAPRSAVSADLRTGVLSTVTIQDRTDGQSVVRLNYGVRRAGARRAVAAVNTGAIPT